MSDADPRAFRIVVSYRRVDTGGDARSLAETLADRFGEENVFFDIHGIAPGEPFDQVIAQAVAASDVFIACIGQHWLTVAAADGTRRIDDPEDYVRRELEGALAAEVRVIPVTFEGAQMPGEDELPDSLKPFSTRNAVDVRATRWHEDVGDFVDYLVGLKRKKLRDGRKGFRAFIAGMCRDSVDWAWHSGRRRRGVVLTSAAVVAALVLGGFGLWAIVNDPGAPKVSADPAAAGGAETGGSETGGSETGGAETTPEPASVSTLAYSAGGQIFFLVGEDGVPSEMKGDELRTEPDWSLPRGTRLAYSWKEDIWSSDRDNGGTVQVTNGPDKDGSPAWSPDGKWIAFTRNRNQVWIVPSGGRPDEARFFAGGGAPDWSSDGQRLVYQRDLMIWVSEFPNAANEHPLIDKYRPALFPSWSPDGRRIAFILPNREGERPSGCSIVMVKPNGKDDRLRNLKEPRTDQCSDVSWSADGRSLVYAGGDAGIYTVPREGDTATQLVPAPGAHSPSWSRP